MEGRSIAPPSTCTRAPLRARSCQRRSCPGRPNGARRDNDGKAGKGENRRCSSAAPPLVYYYRGWYGYRTTPTRTQGT